MMSESGQTARAAQTLAVGEASLGLVQVVSGRFMMGSADSHPSAENDEKPRHAVLLSGYQIGQTPVTQGLYKAVTGQNPSENPASDQHPVESVTWFDAVRFCNALSEACGLTPVYTIGTSSTPKVSCDFEVRGFRLPTEAEWECAARAGEDHQFSGSGNADAVSWHNGNSDYNTQPVAQKQPNAWGLYDMSGNVWEWCWDWYDHEAYSKRASSAADAEAAQPVGPKTGTNRTFRGGSCNYFARDLRLGFRCARLPHIWDLGGGFRVVLPDASRP